MTTIAGFLVGDYGPNGILRIPLGLNEELERTTFADNLSPWGAMLHVGIYPYRDVELSSKKKFIGDIMRLYEGLLEKGFQEIRMAATLTSNLLEGFELRDIGHEMSPDSWEDWCVLGDISEENSHRVSVRGEGVISVARIRKSTGLEE
jgi:hypothetical protein